MPNRAFPLDNFGQLLRAHNGVRTFDFNQTIATRQAGAVPSGGICLSLSCHWIKYHAFDDSLVNHIGGVRDNNGRTLLAFNQQEYRRVIRWQQSIRLFPDWEMAYRAWVRNNRLHIRSDRKTDMGLAAVRNELSRIRDGYALIIIESQNVSYSHAVAAYIGTQDACFFEPNYGEYWFSHRSDFFDFFHFFSNFFYRRSHRQNLGLDSYNVAGIYR
ncbi:hypothetical protein FKG94_08030 [Exilibacterium tricleocarpae]|uniref:Peptidase C58 YopT-type domain-containing protein n=1 Tax=Exilibacterium tricleocarpae TaxID=2591008 RepID=A0A545TZN1_9GAMM|nr:YopT-type cysteine protease domain-containing protein [Exilibacterium tricleocarpae]TQV82665.1 hypothetical protein FKG94_08030 [Exilibacterium tricleocarpae]